jgi:hypothetical protein
MPGRQSGRGSNTPTIADLISLDRAAELSGLTSGHLRLLIRQGDVWGIKVGRNWVTTEEAVREYQARARPRGRPKRPS